MNAAAPPRLVFWETTAGCNLRCLHCRRLNALDGPAPDELSTAQAEAMIASIAGRYRPVLVFSGGEPLMRPDVLDLAVFAGARGLRTALATNGTLVDACTAKSIHAAGISRVSVSLDGGRPATHDRFRGEGRFCDALEGICRLKAAGVGLQVNMTLTRFNAHELPDLYDLCRGLGVDALHIFMMVPVGCGLQLAPSEMLSAEEAETWLQWLRVRELEGVLEIKATCAPQYFRIARQKARDEGSGLPPSAAGAAPGRAGRGCLAGSGVCFVSHAGDVFPCGYLPLKAGSVLAAPFPEIWENSPLFVRLRRPELLGGKCGVCSFKTVCGGCRARAYSRHGDELAEEPFCAYEPPERPGTRGARV